MTTQYPIENSTVSIAPSLLVINIVSAMERQHTRNDDRCLSHFNSNTNVLALVHLSFRRSFKTVIRLLSLYHYNRVVILEACGPDVIIKNSATTVGFRGLPHPSELFGESMSNLKGEPITFTSIGGSLESIQYIFNPLHHWIIEGARRLNTTTKYFEHHCKRNKEFSQCYYDKFQSNDVFFALEQVQLTSNEYGPVFPFVYLFNVPSSMVIMVPRGSTMNTAQLFIMPFSWSVWFVLISVLVAAEIAHLSRPELFSNDPVLLVVCGFEQVNLHQTGRWEKTILLSLIVFIFFMSNAYETKFISLMISKPSTQSIRTVADLSMSGIQILCDGEPAEGTDGRWKLGNLTIQMEYWAHDIAMNGDDAYLVTKSDAELNMVLDIDIENKRRSRYVLLEDSFGMALIGIKQLFRNPLENSFRWTEEKLVESGIMDHWIRIRTTDLKKYYIRPSEIDPETDQMLSFNDFWPAWVALGFGLVTGGVIFVCEFAVGLCIKWIIAGKSNFKKLKFLFSSTVCKCKFLRVKIISLEGIVPRISSKVSRKEGKNRK